MIDCHAHLADESFDSDRAEVLARARDAGVTTVVCVSEGLDDASRVLEISRVHAEILPCLGLHPERVSVAASADGAADEATKSAESGEADKLIELIRKNVSDLVGIGEVGLDYWLAKDDESRRAQKRVLATFVELARELDLPLNVHSRSAGHYAIDLLLELDARRVLMHAFDGKASKALPGVEAGFLFSIPPSVVRSPQKQKLVRRLPLESLALETDSPVLGPQKAERNEPANIRVSLRTIAKIKGVSEQEVEAVTTENARRLFRLPPA